MAMRSKKGKVALAYAMALAMSTTMLSSYSVSVNATTTIENGVMEASNVNSLQPTGSGYSVKTLLEWTAESDPNVRYNRASVKLQDRFTGPVVNPNANPEAKIMNCALTNPQTDDAPSQGRDTESAYTFSYWQYVDSYVYWGGSSRGIFVPPTADIIDAAHKNGVPVLGTVGFPWGSGAGYVDEVRAFLEKNEDGTFPVADKMIEMARFYGFDGWFINQESYGCSKADADLMVEFFTYMHEQDPNIRIGWYDSMTVNGNVSWQDALNPLNSRFFQDNGKTVTDEFFLNYNWDRGSSSFPQKTKVDMSIDTAKELGRSQYDVYAGVEVQQNAYNDKFPVDHLLDEEGKIKLSLAMYCPDSTYAMSKNMEEFYYHDQKFWVGPTGDPSKSDTSQKWVGLANYVADKSAINELPFVTNFNLGHGQDYYINGQLLRDREWNNRALQDYLPTWRWIVDSEGSKLTPSFDKTDAYNGGSSLKIEGNLEAENPNHIKLYSTNLEITDESTEVSVVYKTNAEEDNMKIGLCFGDTYDEENFIFLDVKNGTPGQWNTAKISLADYVGKKISAISLKFDSEVDVNEYKINVGSISVEESKNNKSLEKTSNIVLDDVLYHNAQKAEAKIYWNDVEGTDFYEVYRVKPNGDKEFIGATYNDSYYISPFRRYENEKEFNFEVVAVDKNYNRGEAQSLKFKWNINSDATEVPNENQPVNVALNKSVKVHANDAANPGEKAVDGTVENNSKWCSTKDIYNGWLEVDLGEPKTIKRWVTMHAEAGGEANNMNTKDFRLQASFDGGKTFEDVDVVKNNTQAIVDINLEEPVTSQYFRLYIDNPGTSPWGAIRLYEFQVFEEHYTATTENIPMNTVKAVNNEGANDMVLAKDVPAGYELLLYRNIHDTEPFAREVAGENGEIRIENLDFGKEEGRIYFAAKEEGKERSIKLSVPYDNEEWEVTEIPNNFTISDYKVNPRSLINKYYGVLEIGDLQPGDIVSYYESSEDEFPQKVSVPVAEDSTSIVLKPITFNKDGGDIILQVKREGQKATEKFKLKYKEDKEASTKGNIEIKVQQDSGSASVEGAIYEVLKDGKVIENITTNKSGVALSKDLDPGVYGLRYTGNLQEYSADDTIYEIRLEEAFEKATEELNLKYIGDIAVNKPQKLKAKEVTANTIKITWDAPNKDAEIVSEYLIYVDGKVVATVNSDEVLEHEIINLKANTIHGIKVVAKGKNGKVSKPVSLNVRTTK